MNYIDHIIRYQLTADDGNAIASVFADHEQMIRDMAMFVSMGNAGSGDDRKAFMGIYYDEVQEKVTWAYNTAKDVWLGLYGNGDVRKEALGADYDLVQYWVGIVQVINFPTGIKYTTDLSGKRYLVKDVPTRLGTWTWKGYGQRVQGSNPYRFTASGCGFMSFYACISTIKGYDLTPKAYADNVLASVTGASYCPISMWAGIKMLEYEGIKYEWVKGSPTATEYYDMILSHLRSGNPVIISLSAEKGGSKTYCNCNHYSLLIGATADGKKGYLLDSGWHLPRYVDLVNICKFIPGVKENPDYAALWNGWSNAGGICKVYMK